MSDCTLQSDCQAGFHQKGCTSMNDHWHDYTHDQVETIGRLFRVTERDTLESVGEHVIATLQKARIKLVFPTNETRAERLESRSRELRELAKDHFDIRSIRRQVLIDTADDLESMANAARQVDFGNELLAPEGE